MRTREGVAFLGLSAVVTAALALGGSVLWTRPLWMDEWCTVFIARAESLWEAMRLIAGGGDWSPPVLHVVLWSTGKLAGGLSPVLLRSVSLLFVLGALWFVYAALRRRVEVAPALAGTLAAAGHPLVLAHAFEIRPYAPWLFAAAGFAWALGQHVDADGRRPAIMVAAFSVLLCTFHWFGVLSLALMSGAVVLTFGRDWRRGVRFVAPACAGLAALVALAPLLLAQRASAEGLLWVRPLDVGQIRSMAKTFWLAAVLLAAALVLVLVYLRSRGRREPLPGVWRTLPVDPSNAALVSLLLMPLVLMLVSATIQPVMVLRYAVVAALGWAPLAALAVASVAGGGRWVFVGLLAWSASGNARAAIGQRRAFAQTIRANQHAFAEAQRLGVPVVFQSMHHIYAVAGGERGRRSWARFLELPDSTVRALFPSPRLEPLRRRYSVERHQLRFHERIYGFPVVLTRAALDSTPRFVVLAADLDVGGGDRQAEIWGGTVFPRHRVTRLSRWSALFERAAARDSRATTDSASARSRSVAAASFR